MKQKTFITMLSIIAVGICGMPETGYAATELEGYIGKDLNTAANDFTGMSDITWSMGTSYRSNDWLSMCSSNESLDITQIRLSETEDSYFLCGVHSLMTLDEIAEVMEEGSDWQKLACGDIWYNEDRSDFFSVDEYGGTTTLVLRSVEFGSHQDRQEVFYCIGETMEQVMNEFEGLTIRTENNQVYLEGDGICFSGVDETGDSRQARVTSITLMGETSNYCLYGFAPGDSWSSTVDHGFEEGGSGEYIVPTGDVLILINMESESPSIQLVSY